MVSSLPKPQAFEDIVKDRGVSLDELIAFLASKKEYLTTSHKQQLTGLLGEDYSLARPISETLNLKDQVHKLWLTVDILLDQEVDFSQRKLKTPENARSTTEVLAKATSLASLLAKLYEDVTNQSVLHQTEMATIAALKKFPDLHKAFLTELQAQLGKVT